MTEKISIQVAALAAIFLFIVGLILGNDLGYRNGYNTRQAEFAKMDLSRYDTDEIRANAKVFYDIGYSNGITYQAKVDHDTVVLGLVKFPSGYYILRQNQYDKKINATTRAEAIKRLSEEISPC